VSNNFDGVPTNVVVLPLSRAIRAIKHSGWHWWSDGRRWKPKAPQGLSETSLGRLSGDNPKCQPRAEAETISREKQSPGCGEETQPGLVQACKMELFRYSSGYQTEVIRRLFQVTPFNIAVERLLGQWRPHLSEVCPRSAGPPCLATSQDQAHFILRNALRPALI
jgi:hypothetical protein